MEILDYTVIACMFAVYKAICEIYDRHFKPKVENIDEMKNGVDILTDCYRCSMREILRISHREYYDEKGWISDDELTHLEDCHTAYKALDGNGTGDRWINEIRSLPRKPPAD